MIPAQWPSHTFVETERLLLRPPLRADFDSYAEVIADEEVARYIGGVQPRPTAWRSFMAMAGAWHLEGFAMFSLIEKATGRWLGRVGPWKPEGWPGTEIGWSLRRDAWGKGYAREAAVASIDWAFEHLGWRDVIHTIDLANQPSIQLAERLGSTHLGPAVLPPPHADAKADMWGQTREQWQANRTRLSG